jgi:hypothetical protein
VVQLNLSRGTVQIVNCSGDVIGNVGMNLTLADIQNVKDSRVVTHVLSVFNLSRTMGI